MVVDDRAAGIPAGGPITLTGSVVLLGSATSLGLGLWGHYPALICVGLSGMTIVLLAGLVTARRPHLTLVRESSQQSVSRGEPVDVRLRVGNRGRLPVRTTAIERVRAVGTERRVDVAMPLLAPGRDTQVSYQVPTARRGLLRLGPLELTRADDFGLWRRTISIGTTAEVLVWPTIHTVPVDLTGTATSVEGVARDGAGGSTAFHSLRDYVPGDDRRMIHWRSTARRGELTVRQLVDVVLPRLTIVLDTRSRVYPSVASPDEADLVNVPSGLDAAIETAASVLMSCVGSGVAVQFATTSGLQHEAAETEDTATVLDAMARIEPDASLGLVEICDRLEVRPGARLLLITGPGSRMGEPGGHDAAALEAMARRHDGCLVLVLDSSPAAPADPMAPAADRTLRGPVTTQAEAVTHQSGARISRVASVPDALLAWVAWSRR